MNILTTELVFTGKDGEEYKFVPLELTDLTKFVKWVQYKPFRDAIDAELPENLRDKIYDECSKGLTTEKVKPEHLDEDDLKNKDQLIEEEFTISITSTVVTDNALTIIGLRKLMEISLQKNYTNWKDILTDKIVSNQSNDFLILIGFMKPKSKEAESENPTNPN